MGTQGGMPGEGVFHGWASSRNYLMGGSAQGKPKGAMRWGKIVFPTGATSRDPLIDENITRSPGGGPRPRETAVGTSPGHRSITHGPSQGRWEDLLLELYLFYTYVKKTP